MRSPDLSSAEWIAEAPVDRAVVRLWLSEQSRSPDFGSVSFTKIGAVAGGRKGTVTDTHWRANAVQLVPNASASTAGAVPQGLTAVGNSFAVIWKARTGGPPHKLSPTSPNALVDGLRRP